MPYAPIAGHWYGSYSGHGSPFRISRILTSFLFVLCWAAFHRKCVPRFKGRRAVVPLISLSSNLTIRPRGEVSQSWRFYLLKPPPYKEHGWTHTTWISCKTYNGWRCKPSNPVPLCSSSKFLNELAVSEWCFQTAACSTTMNSIHVVLYRLMLTAMADWTARLWLDWTAIGRQSTLDCVCGFSGCGGLTLSPHNCRRPSGAEVQPTHDCSQVASAAQNSEYSSP